MARGGAREGSGRKPKVLRWAKETAASQGLILFSAPWLVVAMIDSALNGDVSAQKWCLDRLFGKQSDMTPPLIARAEQIEKDLPDDFDPRACLDTLRADLTGATDDGAFTRADAAKAGRAGLNALCRRAMRGDGAAAALLAKFWLGEPVQTWREDVAEMNEDQVRAALVDRYQRAWGLDRETAETMVNAIADKAAEADE